SSRPWPGGGSGAGVRAWASGAWMRRPPGREMTASGRVARARTISQLATRSPLLTLRWNARNSGGGVVAPWIEGRAQAELLHLHLQGLAADAQEAGGVGDVAPRLLQRLLDEVALELGRTHADDVLEPSLGGRGLGHRAFAQAGRGLGAEGWRQVGQGDDRFIGEEDQALDEVLQLADVPRPRVGLQRRQGLIVDPLVPLPQPLVVAPQEVGGERGQILGALPEGRDVEGNDRQSVVEV